MTTLALKLNTLKTSPQARWKFIARVLDSGFLVVLPIFAVIVPAGVVATFVIGFLGGFLTFGLLTWPICILGLGLFVGVPWGLLNLFGILEKEVGRRAKVKDYDPKMERALTLARQWDAAWHAKIKAQSELNKIPWGRRD